MPKIIKVSLRNNPYHIVCGGGTIDSLGTYLSRLKLGTDALVITNSLIKNKHGKAISAPLTRAGFRVKFRLVPDTEKAKSLTMLPGLIRSIAEYGVSKKPFIIAFGGGVVGDLAGFVASIYKRGIPYIQVPTTLLAQVDSAIGGKTALDLAYGKNLVGAFYQPKLVVSDIGLLKTLSPRQVRSGMAEVIKYAVIKDRRLFNYLEKNSRDILALKPAALEYIVARSSRIKADIVIGDERETKGRRTVLNFGHTLGHAIETASGYTGYNHGEAVGLGMLIACGISTRLRLLEAPAAERIAGLIKCVGLPVKIKDVPLSSIIKAHYRDKKFIGPSNKLVLITGIGKTKIVNNVPLRVIKSAIKAVM
ncbi:MAG: 3-dehydroquinate synthase [Candidatus Omnitrophota bacterium]|nr:3-dehydroquinate synthase [Candidatus Omnitrophota bacterium]